MSEGWAPDPWARFGFRWFTDLGWTEHVSDGTNRFVDAPGDRPPAAVPPPPPPPPTTNPPPVVLSPTVAAAAATTRVVGDGATVRPAAARATAGTDVPAATRAAPAPPPGRDRLRWVWIGAAMVSSFVLGAVVFGGDDRDSESGDTTVATTVAETVPPTVATTVPETAPPTPPPTTAPPDPEQVARNDRQIDDLEWGLLTYSFAPAFGIELPPRESAVALGNQLCDAAASAPTPADLETALAPILEASGLPPGQAGIMLGGYGAVMCMDTLVALGLGPAV